MSIAKSGSEGFELYIAGVENEASNLRVQDLESVEGSGVAKARGSSRPESLSPPEPHQQLREELVQQDD